MLVLMLLPPRKLQEFFSVRPRGVLHVGAHRAEELPGYRHSNFGPVIWVEAQEHLIPDLRRVVEPHGDVVLDACVWSEAGIELTLKISSNGESTSLYHMGTHELHHPHISVVREVSVTTSVLSDIVPEDFFFDFVNLDIQGAELEALKGMGILLDEVKWVYVEVNREALYEGIPLVDELANWLKNRGFVRAVSLWTEYEWGDSLFIRMESRSHPQKFSLMLGAIRSIFWFRSYPMRRMFKEFKRYVVSSRLRGSR